MEVVLSTFSKYLQKNGVLDQEGVNYMNKMQINENNSNMESLMLSRLSDHLKNTIKEKKTNNLASSIYEKFISLDDEKIVKTIRKLLIIYRSKLRKVSQMQFLKWRLITHKLKFIQRSVNVVYKKKKVQDISITEDREKENDIRVTSHNNSVNGVNTNKSGGMKSTQGRNFQIQSTNNESVLKSKDMSIDLKEEVKSNRKEQSVYTSQNNSQILNHPELELRNLNNAQMVVNKVENFTIDKKPMQVHEKLYKERVKRDMLYSEMARHYQYQEIKDCTFTPKINNYTPNKNKKPITINPVSNASPKENKEQVPKYLKLYDGRKEKEDHMRFLSLEKEKRMNEVYTFRPVTYNNYRMKRQSSDFFERQKNYSSSKIRNLKKIQEDVEKSLPSPSKRLRNCSSVLKTPLSKSRDSSLIGISTDRHDRLYDYQRRKEENLKKIETSMYIEQGVTFKPRLNENINSNINSSLIERNEEFMRNKSLKIRNITSADDYECTFTPKVNTKSRVINDEEHLPVGDRLFQYQNKYKEKQNQKKEVYKESYSFKPEINSNTYEILRQRELIMEEIKNKYNSDNTQDRDEERNENDGRIRIREIEENPNENDSQVEEINTNVEQTVRSNNTHSNSNTNRKSYQEDITSKSVKMSSTSPIKVTNTNNKPHNTKLKANTCLLQNVSDSRLLEMANQYITTDESLEKFQARLREKYSKITNERNDYMMIVENSLKDKKKTQPRSFNQVQFNSNSNNTSSSQVINTNQSIGNKKSLTQNKNSLSKNIAASLDYYDKIQV